MTNEEIRRRHHGKEIQKIEDKYGLLCFRMGLSHLFDCGHQNITEECVEKTKIQIMKEAEADTSGNISLFSPETQCHLMDIVLELAQFSLWDLLAYVKTNVEIG